MRRASPVALAAVPLSACGGSPDLRSAGLLPSPASPGTSSTTEPTPSRTRAPAAATPATASPTRTPSASPSRTRIARPAPKPTRTISGESSSAEVSIFLVRLETNPDGVGHPGISAMDQQGCGSDETALLFVHVMYLDWPTVRFTWRTNTPVVLSGDSGGNVTVGGETGDHWSGLIGPIEALPANRAGGTVTVSAHVSGRQSAERTFQRTYTLKPCH